MKQLIGNSATNNSLFMIFELLLRAVSPYPCSMSWSILKSTIVTWSMNIGVTSCQQYRPKNIGKLQRRKSRNLQLQRQPLFLTATSLWGFRVRRRQGLVFVSNSNRKRLSSSTVHRIIVCFARRKGFLSESICSITLKIVLAKRSDQNSIKDGLGGGHGNHGQLFETVQTVWA